MRIFAFRRQPLTATSSDRHHFSTKGGYKGVTRMAYSPSLWLMAIGWWNEINQCRELKLNLTLTWGVCMSLDSGMHWSQNQWYCDDKLRKEWIQSSKEQTHAESKHSFKEVSVSHAQLALSAHLQKKSTCFSSWTYPHSHLSQMLEPPCHLQDFTLKWCARNLNMLKFLNTCLSKSLYK